MRVISGTAKGHKLKTGEGLTVRPTTDRVKENIFNVIRDSFPCGTALDLFSGSGSLGIEGLSRGARKCVFVDCMQENIRIINDNLIHTKLAGRAQVVKSDAFDYLKTARENFDIIFLDPPYNKGYLRRSLSEIANGNVLNHSGIIVAESEHGGEGENVEIDGLDKIFERKYGNTVITIYKYIML